MKESHKKVFSNLYLFKGFIDKTLYNFAEKIEMKIAHPEEIVKSISDDFNLMILKQGTLGYVCRNQNWPNFNDLIINTLKVKNDETPLLTSMSFIYKKRQSYEIKSLEYSILLAMDYDKFITILKETDMDYELYCLLRDKIKNIPD